MTAIRPPEENAIRSARTHPTSKATSTVASAGTVTARSGAPLTVQFSASPLRVTVWGPAITLRVTTPFTGTTADRKQGFPEPSTQTKYPFRLTSVPLVAAVTRMLPAAAHVTTNGTSVLAFAVTVRGFSPLTVQLEARPLSSTTWVPAATGTVTPLFTPIAASYVAQPSSQATTA